MMCPETILSDLYSRTFGHVPAFCRELPPSGSYRRYFRMGTGDISVIGAWNQDVKENAAFFAYTHHFRKKGIPVPEIYAQSSDAVAYLLEDLGEITLLDYLHSQGTGPSALAMYKKTVEFLLEIQISGSEGLDFSVGYPRKAFDRQSMAWDMNYFKYYFLKLARVPFDEQDLEDDFQRFADYLLTADSHYFLYRDFQSRNIMIRNDGPWFIDYQGGRQGALYYDIASLLFEAKTFLPEDFRQEVLHDYLERLSTYQKVDEKKFMEYFYAFVFIRTMQAMGAYGFRGLYEKKPLFLESIPPALAHMRWLTEHVTLPVHLPELWKVWERLKEVDPGIGSVEFSAEGPVGL